jgi:hypothetical protein
VLVHRGSESTMAQGDGTPEVLAPPAELIRDAKAAFERHPRREIAHLEFDSLVDGDGIPGDHSLLFEHRRLSIELHISAIGPTARLTGAVHPPLYDRVYLHRNDADVQRTEAVVDGRFQFQAVGRGLIRLSVIPKDERPAIWSDWFRL